MALEGQVLPAILEQKRPDEPVRVWVAGCSTGEEAYSIGISLLEALEDVQRPVQIFASDLSEVAIGQARVAVYAEAAVRDVSDERRRRYFDAVDGGYRINEGVRKLCVFMQHDLTRDPPLANADLVSCRNVLVCFDDATQESLVQSLHRALNQPGYLLVGRAETLSSFARFFSVVDDANKIFARVARPASSWGLAS